jgi:Tol biopolymer transport system component
VSGALVYASEGDIYVADPDGANAVAITDIDAVDDECPGELSYQLPSWSPDGRYLAFRGPRDPACESPTGVVITDPQGNVVATFPGQEQINVMAPAWSPDSTRVAVWDEYTRAIGVYRIDGTRETQIEVPPGTQGDIGYLAWMPDGASLLVDQYEVPLDGGTPRELPFPFTEFNSWPQQYSPDGSLVAYATRHGLMVARPDGSEPRVVFGRAPYTWTWSPTGELIALTTATPGERWPPNELHVVDVAAGSSTLLFEGAGPWVNGFSPESDRILFINENGGNSPLWSVGIDGSDARPVQGTGDGAWRPV